MFRRTLFPLLASALLLSLFSSTLTAQSPVNTGEITSVAGGPTENYATGLDVHEGETALNSKFVSNYTPKILATDTDGNFYFVVGFCGVVKVDAAGTLTRLAGQLVEEQTSVLCGFSGDGGPAIDAKLSEVESLAVDSVHHKLYISDPTNLRLRVVNLLTGDIDTALGNGTAHYYDNSYMDDMSEVAPRALATDKDGNLFIHDNIHSRLLRMDASSGVVTRIAGNGTYSSNPPVGDGGDAKLAGIRPWSLAVDQQGNIYLGETKFVRRIAAATNIISTVAGSSWSPSDPSQKAPRYKQTGPALSLGLNGVFGIAASPDGHVFFTDIASNLIYRLDVAASHVDIVNRPDYTGDDFTPKQVSLAGLFAPYNIAFNSAGDLLVADWHDWFIRRIANAANMPVGNVPVGNGVTAALSGGVAAPDGVSLTFDSTTAAGDAVLTKTAGGTPALPTGFTLGTPSTYYNITSTATFSGNVLVCINYSGTSYTDPSQLKLYHYDHSGAWVDITTSLYPQSTTICGITDSFSPFAIVEPRSTTPPVDLAIRNSGPTSVSSGKNLSYQLSVANFSSQPAIDVTIADTLPLGVSFISASWAKGSCSAGPGKSVSCSSLARPAACSASGRTVTCSVGALDGSTSSRLTGALATMTVRVTATKGATLSDTGTVGSAGVDSNSANNSSTVLTQVTK